MTSRAARRRRRTLLQLVVSVSRATRSSVCGPVIARVVGVRVLHAYRRRFGSIPASLKNRTNQEPSRMSIARNLAIYRCGTDGGCQQERRAGGRAASQTLAQGLPYGVRACAGYLPAFSKQKLRTFGRQLRGRLVRLCESELGQLRTDTSGSTGGPGSRHMKLLFLRDLLVLSIC